MASVEIKLYPISRSRIKDLPEHRRPRETILDVGVRQVPDEVLLAVLLRTGGSRGQSVIDLARNLLDAHQGSLSRLAEASIEELQDTKGMGTVKAIELQAACELARRIFAEINTHEPIIRCAQDVVAQLQHELPGLTQETVWLFLLDTKHKLIVKPIHLTKGLLNASLLHPRETFREAIRRAAASIIVAHNHPSGDPTPSQQDIKTTRALIETGKTVGIPLIDHIILGKSSSHSTPQYISLREQGLLPFE